MSTNPPLRDDLLTGAEEIASYLGWSVRKVYHAHNCGHLPIIKAGHNLISRKSQLSERLSAKRDDTEAA